MYRLPIFYECLPENVVLFITECKSCTFIECKSCTFTECKQEVYFYRMQARGVLLPNASKRCTLASSTTSVSAEAGQLELTRRTSFVASHLELLSYLPWYWCVSRAGGSCLFPFFLASAQGLRTACIRQHCLIYLYNTAAVLAYDKALGATHTCTQF